MPRLINEVSVKADETVQDLLAHRKKKKETPKKNIKFPKTLFIRGNHLPRHPGVMGCSNCLMPIPKTLKVTVITRQTHAVAALMTPVLCTWAPYAFSFAKTLIHKCPFCDVQLGVSEFNIFGGTKGSNEDTIKSVSKFPKEGEHRQESGGQPRIFTLLPAVPTGSDQDGGASKKSVELEDMTKVLVENNEDSEQELLSSTRLVSRTSPISLPFLRKALSSAALPMKMQYEANSQPMTSMDSSSPTKSEDEVAAQRLYAHLSHTQLLNIHENVDENGHTAEITRRICRHKQRHNFRPPHSHDRNESTEIAPELFSNDERRHTRSLERKCMKCNRPKRLKDDESNACEPSQ